MSSEAVATRSDRLPSGLALAAIVALALGALLSIGPTAHPSALERSSEASGSAPSTSYAGQAAALLARYDASISELDSALTERDGNPALVLSDAWVQRYARVVSELQGEYQAALALSPPAGQAEAHTCLTESLRLTSTGATMLHDAFLTGGHGAYFLSAHGNWDLNLGITRLRQCRSLLHATK